MTIVGLIKGVLLWRKIQPCFPIFPHTTWVSELDSTPVTKTQGSASYTKRCCYGSFAYTRTLDLSDSAKACAVLKAVSHLQDFLTTTILLSPFFFSDSFLMRRPFTMTMEEESVTLLLQQLQELRTEMRTQKQQLQEENNSLRAELQAVRNSQLRNHPPVTTTVTSATPTPYERSYPRPRHPDVEPFTGEDPKDYPPFQMNLLYYAYSRMRGKASQRVLPWLLARQKSETPVLWAEFSAVLDKAFGDPDRQRKALVRVNTIKQGRRDFEEFLNEFDEELLNAGGINWDDNQKKALLDTAINVELLKAMGWLTRKGSHAAVPMHVARTRPAGGSDRTGTPDQMDWEATHAQIAALQKEVAALRMKGTRTPRKASQAPAEEKQKRLSEGKCLRCGDPDHFVQLDIGAHTEKGAYFYVIPDNLGYDLILGLPWLEQHDGRLEAKRGRLYLRTTGVRLWSTTKRPLPKLDIAQISAATMGGFIQRKRCHGQDIEIFAVSLADIQKALAPKRHIDPRTKLPRQYWKYLRLFEQDKAEELPPHRGDGIDHKIELVREESGKDPEVPWGPLYNMTQEELIVLRKTLSELLQKGFIRVSHSPAAAPVLFVRKPGGGLRFCVDYRALNAITKKDRYPLPLIHETLNQIGQARWFTKLDVSAAFHKIRIAKGQEWMTAFRTRYGLFEWLVTPFGLANAPSTFQKYINWTLREYLDEFCSAYIDDVLVYTNGDLRQHRKHVRMVLKKLEEAGLYLDIKKCEFECKETKYLGFIIQAGKGIKMDPEKVKAIKEWETPTTIKGVRGFLGFANFYRRFIPNFSGIKGTPFLWTKECQDSFDLLKEKFITGPVLATFNPSYRTVVETDSSGYNTGGVLSQYNEKGELHPCAYFSKRNSPAECNYEIYDKELLAIVRCLEAWDAELRSCGEFQVITDHKNLEYFFSPRKLTERHVRWSLFLSRFNFKLVYRKGSANQRADALSRRDQDMPDDKDDRVKSRTMQLFSKKHLGKMVVATLQPTGEPPREPCEKGDMWKEALKQDKGYNGAIQCLKDGARKFPPHLQLKVGTSECQLDAQGYILFRGRRWVPGSEQLRTNIIQAAHDSMLTGHPGREQTYMLVSRINRRLSTAHHPQTDGSTERMNSTVETYLRIYTCYDQRDWNRLLPLAELAINGPLPEEVEQLAEEPAKSPIQKGEAIVRKVKEALDWAQASMAYSQQNAENQANKHRSPATNYQVGDKVWLSLKNICTDRPSKKLDWKNAKYEVIGLVGSHAVRLNTPPGIHPVFHVDLLRLASSDPLPSQKNDDTQPPGIIVNGEKEYMVEKILDERPRRYGRGHRLEYLVKWSGYARPTWEAATALEEAQALDEWLDRTKQYRLQDGSLNRDAYIKAKAT
ncbi:hypothetical protein AN0376.2 [Aspergillus nidulans FGSC A4]|uniref:RNA-directed DNA polymerase n=1 Tax=Emericella nidulans (strain FGSC A4 / ATCC 38163 / CBS 112.46 / NRRL 194 / M139) TaxID=227321 RepID=Q5BGF4_EMENI|nr:hypothetical protein [Aspergillus nidulans FGSC A4]EAA65782.1 hypothetical protein AN0376.2 [Aspergillus nidulans FGSC A4]CBF89606.1 TPA: conserved hypothetical protein [Aspergillus nidulans FGSC A4]|eukprot:XP_657980.1 hypothetical protein AN0376.2 [Aspergillus nidulans FGSC A4]